MGWDNIGNTPPREEPKIGLRLLEYGKKTTAYGHLNYVKTR
jgi:hypothetical protein